MRADPGNIGSTFSSSIGPEEDGDNPPFTVGLVRVGSRAVLVEESATVKSGRDLPGRVRARACRGFRAHHREVP